MKKFKQSLDIGNKGQKFFTQILDFNNIKYEISNGIAYDVKALNQCDYTFECKYDIYCEKSGNVAIEVWNTKKNKPSGIMATKATFWVHILSENEIWIQYVKVLKKIVNEIPCYKVVEGGDSNSKMILYKKTELLDKYFKLLTKENYVRTIKELSSVNQK